MILILIQHIHVLMYVPTIAVIVVLRYYLAKGFNRQNVPIGIVALAAVGGLFLAAQFYGTMTVPEDELVRYLRSRMADPSRSNLLSFAYIWYQPLSQEIHDTWNRMPSNLSSARRHRRRCRGQPLLSDYVRDRVRLFAMDFELGGLHVPDPARGKNLAGRAGRAADCRGRPKDHRSRLDRDVDPAGRGRAAVLILGDSLSVMRQDLERRIRT